MRRVELQGDADDLVSLPLEQGCGCRGVDTAGHGDNDGGFGRHARSVAKGKEGRKKKQATGEATASRAGSA